MFIIISVFSYSYYQFVKLSVSYGNCKYLCLSVRSQKETAILAKSGPKPLETLQCMTRKSIADTHIISLDQLSDSTEHCALSRATQSHRGDNRL